MRFVVDTDFDVYTDTPPGKDPDALSPMLRSFHKTLWSKALPGGELFELSLDHPKAYLYHRSNSREFFLSSDSVGHTYRNTKAMSPIVSRIPVDEMKHNLRICSTVGGYVIFPSKKIDRKPTINGARGLNWKIKDRFDLTLECIRRHYQSETSPLGDVLARYADFFSLFGTFEGYVDFFLLQDLIENNQKTVRTFLPFSNFQGSPLPQNLTEYRSYIGNVTAFIQKRNQRISITNSS